MPIHIKYYGVRGSTPTPGMQYDKYGGNTTCVYIKIDGQHIIIDSGTGIRNLGLDLLKIFPKEGGHAHILFTHTHWDHIQGFPFFVPIYMPSNKFDIYGETKVIPANNRNETWTIENVLSMQQNFMYFPVRIKDLPSNLNFHELKPEVIINPGSFEIHCKRLRHPNDALGFRFNYNKKSYVYCTDIEHSDAMTEELVKFAMNADVMAYDCQYTPEEYTASKIGWGHSTYEVAAEIAIKANIKHVHMIHHDPMHTDTFLQDMEKSARKLFKNMIMIPEGFSFDI
ncbi:MAG: MBL fold metallo-hydrolase [Spirochaetia bacterium]|nr:MBL fold metallo-hydrolase [Spirochaetia bacterium]